MSERLSKAHRDVLHMIADRAHFNDAPALAATCPCGGSFEVSRHVTPAERRRALTPPYRG